MAKAKKRKQRRNVSQGVAHIKATFNNTIVTITDKMGDALCFASAGVAGSPGGVGKLAGELAVQQPVEALELLLFTQAGAVFRGLRTAGTVHAGSLVATLDGALGGLAARALEIQLHAFAAAQLANRCRDTAHVSENHHSG